MIRKFTDLFSRKAAEVPSPVEPPPVERAGVDPWLQRGSAHIAQQQWQAALDCFQEVVRLEPAHAMAHATIGNLTRQLGNADAALAAYDRAIAVRPDYAEVHYNRGTLLQQARQLRAALDSYNAALSQRPAFAEALCARGDVLAELDRTDEALASYDAAIAANPPQPRATLNRGVLQQKLGQLAAAEASYRQAIALRPTYADAHFNLGTLLRIRGLHAEALTSHDTAIALAPGHAGAHGDRGLVLLAQGNLEAALASFDQAIGLKPDFARVYSNRAQVQARLGRRLEARASHDQAVALAPGDAELHFNRGNFLNEQNDRPAAIASLRTAIGLQPGYVDALYNLGCILHEDGQWEAALDAYSQAVAMDPQLAAAFNNRGDVYRAQGNLAAAAQDFQRAIEIDPAAADAHFNNGQLALLRGDLAAGWPEYEWRALTTEGRRYTQRTFLQPAWTGAEPLAGKGIFLHPEQGLGDTLQFCRYVPLVRALGARVVLETPPALAELLATLDGPAERVLPGTSGESTDFHCSLMSLPGAFRTTLSTIPGDEPYLRVDPARVARWQQTLGPASRPRVGLAWSGNALNRNDRNRSIALAQLIEYLPDGIDYLCLQNDIRESDQAALRAFGRIRTTEPAYQSFPDTAALMEVLDLVVSVDTSLAHLGGALGRNTWVLLPFIPDWRWLLDRRDSPWYPCVTLYRQPAAGDWNSILAEVRRDLVRLVTD
jgi:tetratricopeptide (TPR) repeat protein